MIHLVILLLACGSDAFNVNQKVDETLERVAGSVISALVLNNYNFRFGSFPIKGTLQLNDNVFEDATSLMRVSDAVLSPLTNGQSRLQVEVTLMTMKITCGQFDFRLPLLHFGGSGQFELLHSRVGVSAFFEEDCRMTRVYVWPPHGSGRLTVRSSSFFSRAVEFVFNLLDSNLIGDMINNDLIGDAVVQALRDPLTTAMKDVFCPVIPQWNATQ